MWSYQNIPLNFLHFPLNKNPFPFISSSFTINYPTPMALYPLPLQRFFSLSHPMWHVSSVLHLLNINSSILNKPISLWVSSFWIFNPLKFVDPRKITRWRLASRSRSWTWWRDLWTGWFDGTSLGTMTPTTKADRVSHRPTRAKKSSMNQGNFAVNQFLKLSEGWGRRA